MPEAVAKIFSKPTDFYSTQAIPAVFVSMLLFVTVLFYALVPLATTTWWPVNDTSAMYGMLLYLNTIHVAFTAFVYFDRSSYRVISKNRGRFFIGVPALFVSFFVFFLYSPPGYTAYFFLLFGFWSFWHFQKQHYGVFSFLNIYYSSRTRRFENYVILAATAPAMIAITAPTIISRGEGGSVMVKLLTTYSDQLDNLSLIIFVAVGLAGAFLALKRFQEATDQPLRNRLVMAASLIFFSTNYWPFLFIKPLTLAAGMSTGGHGLQYCVFMAIYAYSQSGHENSQRPMRQAIHGICALLFMMALGMGIWFVLVTWLPAQQNIFGIAVSSSLTAALASIGIAITGAHYLLDAVLWKLSDKDSRELIREKYSFFFNRAK